MILFFYVFLPLFDVDTLHRSGDLSAAQIVDCRIRNVGCGDGLDGGVMTVQSGDGKAEAGVMGEPDKVVQAVEGDFRHLV